MFATTITAARRKAAPASVTLVAGLAAVGLAAPTAAATSVPPGTEGETVVVDTGDLSQPVDLLAQPALGDAATNTAVSTVEGTLVLSGTQERSVDLDVATTVVESAEVTAADAAGLTIRRVVDSYDVADSSSESGVGESFASDEELAELVGVDLDYLFGPDNRLQDVVPAEGVELTAAQLAAVDEVIADGIGKAELPSEPVGVGAQWTASMPGGGPAGGLVATYTLVSFVDGEFTVEVSVSGDGSSFYSGGMPQGFDEVSGTFEGSGTLVGNVDEPLVRSIELDLDLDLTLTGAANEMTMDLTMTENETSVAA